MLTLFSSYNAPKCVSMCKHHHQGVSVYTKVTKSINLKALCILYIGQAFHYSPENAFYIFNQQIYFII